MDNFSNEDQPLLDAQDIEILMHREAHFGGKFEFMLDYYAKEGKGVQQDFEIEKIQSLQLLEQQLNQNLVGLLLSGPDAERIAKAKEAYKRLRKLYEGPDKTSNRYAKLLANLIVSEDSEPTKEIQEIVAEKEAIVPSLLNLLKSEEYHDPLSPGYGLAPRLAIKCLGLIGDKRSVIGLFESIGGSDFFDDELSIEALHLIGKPAKDFLLHVVHARPITFDNERAAMALLPFKDDPEVSKAALEQLETLDLNIHALFATYLILLCEGLKETDLRKRFTQLKQKKQIPKNILQDINSIEHSWQQI